MRSHSNHRYDPDHDPARKEFQKVKQFDKKKQQAEAAEQAQDWMRAESLWAEALYVSGTFDHRFCWCMLLCRVSCDVHPFLDLYLILPSVTKWPLARSIHLPACVHVPNPARCSRPTPQLDPDHRRGNAPLWYGLGRVRQQMGKLELVRAPPPSPPPPAFPAFPACLYAALLPCMAAGTSARCIAAGLRPLPMLSLGQGKELGGRMLAGYLGGCLDDRPCGCLLNRWCAWLAFNPCRQPRLSRTWSTWTPTTGMPWHLA